MTIRLKVDITLKSDAIFSSGFSVPGGDDISVYKDKLGQPYFKATSFKGILRQSVENLVEWQDKDMSIVDDLFGKEALDFEKEHLQFTSFHLLDTGKPIERIYSSRAFTEIDNGVTKDGSLRSAEVINRGLVFRGEVICSDKDKKLVCEGIQGIKGIGLLRNRGYGAVSIGIEREKIQPINREIHTSKYLHYKLETIQPLVITDVTNSGGNHYKTKSYITGAAIRGMVLNHIANHKPEFFERHKVQLLETRFLNAILCKEGHVMLPTVKGFYEDKAEKDLENVVVHGTFEGGKKRASLGNSCAIEGENITCFSTDVSAITRIKKNEGLDNLIFSMEVIDEKQQFEGYIVLESEMLAGEIANAFAEEIWIGGDKYQGFGKCKMLEVNTVSSIHTQEAYGYRNQEEIGEELYLVALSPFTMLDDVLEPCGINEVQLAEKLGVDTVEVEHCSTSTSTYSGFNRVWKARNTEVTMYDVGCIFKLKCSSIPKLEKIKSIQIDGLGVRKEEGFGEILFLRSDIIKSIKEKKKDSEDKKRKVRTKHRQNKIQWIMDNQNRVHEFRISKSQLGEIQELCEKGNRKDLEAFWTKRAEKPPESKVKYQGVRKFIQQFMEASLEESMGIYSDEVKFQVLCELFDFSRKGGR